MDGDEVSYSSEEEYSEDEIQQEAAPKKAEDVGEQERRWVIVSKTLLVIVLLASAGVVGYLTHWFIEDGEQEDFKTKFAFDAKDVLDISSANARSLEQTIRSMTLTFTSYSNSLGATHPNFTLPVRIMIIISSYWMSVRMRSFNSHMHLCDDFLFFGFQDFEAFSSAALESTGALSLAYSPIVTDATREGFEDYAVQNRAWIADSFEFRGEDFLPVSISEYIYKKTSRNNIPEDPPGPYSPLWMLSPPPTEYSVIMFNLFNQPTFRRLAQFCTFTKEPAISEVINTESLLGPSAPQGDDPQSIFMAPVFQTLGNPNVVGFVTMVIPWIIFFENILTDDDSIVDAVLQSSCGEAFTYRIQGGQDPVYRGKGDLHETAYEGTVRSSQFMGYSGNLTGVNGLEAHCQYEILVSGMNFSVNFCSERPLTIADLHLLGLCHRCHGRRAHYERPCGLHGHCTGHFLFCISCVCPV